MIKKILFTKAEGAQNDFVIVDDRSETLSFKERQRFSQLSSHRRRGIGSDGTIFIGDSVTHDFAMHFFNPDGSVGSMCGNGGRCAALFAMKKNIAAADMSFEVLGRSYTASVNREEVTLDFPAPSSVSSEMEVLTTAGRFHLYHIDTGAPHVVLMYENLPGDYSSAYETLNMNEIGKLLRHHERFAPIGTNVNVLQNREGILNIRTFEKGVEGETEACGTGAVAAAIAAHLHYGLMPPLELHTHGGDVLWVGFIADNNYCPSDIHYYGSDLYLRGPARLVFEGVYVFESFAD